MARAIDARDLPRELVAASLTVTLPMPPRAVNTGAGKAHWAVQVRARRAYLAACDARQAAGLVPSPPRVPLPRAVLSSVMYLGAAMDDDNALARHKRALDWLVTRGYLAGDSRRHVRWAGMPEQVVRRGQDYRLVLTLTPDGAAEARAALCAYLGVADPEPDTEGPTP